MVLTRLAEGLLALYSVCLLGYGLFGIYMIAYSRLPRGRREASRTQLGDDIPEPAITFTCLLPARNEKDVIAGTIHGLCSANYPEDMLEILILLEKDDTETIGEARRAARGHRNVKVLVLEDEAASKPHAMNVALKQSSHDVIAIFDAEDDIQPGLFRSVNAQMLRRTYDVVQGPCQLIDYRASWYAMQNAVEYYFWFRSRLHYHARVGSTPLGGNTVFMRRDQIDAIGGWDEHCLTEDADIGIRLSARGASIGVMYDPACATREETPATLASFIRQRTRWAQGFLQVLRKADWHRLSTVPQRLLALYTLSYPIQQVIVALLFLPLLCAAFKLPVFLAILTAIPIYVIVFQYALGLIGLFEFGDLYQMPISPRDVLVFTIGYVPYQILLGISSCRAVIREAKGIGNWEKTSHFGSHRRGGPANAPGNSKPRDAERVLQGE